MFIHTREHDSSPRFDGVKIKFYYYHLFRRKSILIYSFNLINIFTNISKTFLVQHISEPTKGRGTNELSHLDLVLTGEDTMIPKIETTSALGRSDYSIIKVVLNCSSDYDPLNKTVYKYDKEEDYTKTDDILNNH